MLHTVSRKLTQKEARKPQNKRIVPAYLLLLVSFSLALVLFAWKNRPINSAAEIATESVLIPVGEDTYISTGHPYVNFGHDESLRLGGYPGTQFRTLLKFDIGSYIPPGATIQSADLRLQPVDTSPVIQFKVYRLSRSWSEYSVTSLGDPYLSSDPYFNFTLTSFGGTQNFNITQFVQEWVNGTKVNNGLELIPSYTYSDFRELRAREWTYNLRSEIYVTYTYIPAPTIVGEARLDIGMPYNANRGCSSPYIGCGGPFHGFHKGVCTDLAMDAYGAGVPFDIQSPLYQDHLANPGRYRYGTARNAEDMRRYFIHNQQLIAHSEAYQPGDIAFFDWTGDGITDHVNIISEVDGNGRPLKMVDATGVYSGNPSGAAFEHSWSSDYNQYSQGHGRLTGTKVSGTAEAPEVETLQALRISVTPASVKLRLSDANGKSTSESYNENLVASNVEPFIPYIPGGSYVELGSDKVISVTQPLSNTVQYFVQLEGQANVTYNLLIETLEETSVTDTQVFTGTIGTGETQGLGLVLTDSGSGLEFTASSPAPAPAVNIPNSLEMSGLVGTLAELTFDVTEVSGQVSVNSASISITNLTDQLGGTVLSSAFSISPLSFDVATNSSQTVTMQVNTNGLKPGVYQGSLVLTTQNVGIWMIPFTLDVQFHEVLLPVTIKN